MSKNQVFCKCFQIIHELHTKLCFSVWMFNNWFKTLRNHKCPDIPFVHGKMSVQNSSIFQVFSNNSRAAQAVFQFECSIIGLKHYATSYVPRSHLSTGKCVSKIQAFFKCFQTIHELHRKFSFLFWLFKNWFKTLRDHKCPEIPFVYRKVCVQKSSISQVFSNNSRAAHEVSFFSLNVQELV